MKLQGRRQSTNLVDARRLTPDETRRYEESRVSKRAQDKARENDFKDNLKADRIPKRMVGFDSRDMERSVIRNRTVKKLQSIGMKSR